MRRTSAIPPTTTSLAAPWLLDEQDIQALGDVLDASWAKMEEIRTVAMQELLDSELAELKEQYPDEDQNALEHRRSSLMTWDFKESERTCVLKLKGGTRVEAETLKEALKRREVLERPLVGLDVKLKSGKLSATTSTSSWDGSLDLEVRPDSNVAAQEIFEELLHWRGRVAAPPIVAFWRKWSVLAFFAALFPLYLFLMTFASTESSRNSLAWRQEAFELLNDGLDGGTETTRALEILLALEAGYPAENPPVHQGVGPVVLRLRIISLAVTLALLVLVIAPRSAIGVGPGRRRLALNRWWIRLVGVGVPVTLFGSFVVEPIVSWIKQSL